MLIFSYLSVPTSVVMVNEGPFPVYNGTVYNLTGVFQLDTSIVDTNVTVMWVWSLNDQVSLRWSTFAAPHRIIIPINPLATDSSGLYSLNLNIVPRNSSYVTGNSDSSTTYRLTVLREFWILIISETIHCYTLKGEEFLSLECCLDQEMLILKLFMYNYTVMQVFQLLFHL